MGPGFELSLAEYRARERQRARAEVGAAYLEQARAWRKFKRAGLNAPGCGVPVEHYMKSVRLTKAIVRCREAKHYLSRYSGV